MTQGALKVFCKLLHLSIQAFDRSMIHRYVATGTNPVLPCAALSAFVGGASWKNFAHHLRIESL